MEPSQRPLLLLLLLSCLCLLGLAAVAAAKKRPLFVFGDSQLDAGNNNYIVTDSKANIYPYGITHLPRSGRFSNGYMLADYVAKYLNIARPKPYLAAQNKKVTWGLNFASGAAGILNTTNAGRTIPMPAQLGYFLGLIASKKISAKVASQAVYLINFGANDITRAPTNPAQIPLYLQTLVQQYAGLFQTLYEAGARNFIYITVPPIGCLPSTRASLGGPFDALGCNPALNALTAAFNNAVNRTLLSPQFIFNPSLNTKLATLDLFSLLVDSIQNKEKYGFNTLDACCGGPGALNGIIFCGTSLQLGPNGGVQGNVSYVLCKDINKHVFWDIFHATEKAVKLEATQLWSGGAYTTPTEGAEALFK